MTLPPDLPRRATACPGWDWLPGMRATRPDGSFPMRMVEPGCWAHEGESGARIWAAQATWGSDVPDLTDGATRGRLLDLVRKAWGPLSYVGWDGRQWVVYDHNAATSDDGRAPVAIGGFEAEALVVALERAPVAR